MFCRFLEQDLRRRAAAPCVEILFGARQTGKSTLVRRLFSDVALRVNLANPVERLAYAAEPGRFIGECLSLQAGSSPAVVVVDEAQTVPALFDAVQHLFDEYGPARFKFVLLGSSARKLRAAGANLLPGRSVVSHLYPLTLSEEPGAPSQAGPALAHPFPLALPRAADVEAPPARALEQRLLFGELPGIVATAEDLRADLLRSYVATYLEEEVRREAAVRDLARFTRFLRLAAAESGCFTNYASLARSLGLTIPTIKGHYQILEDMFVGFRVPSFAGGARQHEVKTPRFYLFDVGVRNAAAGLPLEPATVAANPGPLFEQWVAIELHSRVEYLHAGRLCTWRTCAGVEVDFVVEGSEQLLPVEAKWTSSPDRHDARHLLAFLEAHPRAPHGWLVCRCPRPLLLHERVTALPWWLL